MSGFFPVNTWDEVTRAILVMEQAGSIGTAHLLRALASGRIALLPILPDESSTKFKAFARMTGHRPAVVLIGDDDGFDRGPGGWAQAGRALSWAKSVMLHGAGAELFHYEAVITAAELTRRTLIVECSTATLPVWVELVKAAPHRPETVLIQAAGGPHPLPVARETWEPGFVRDLPGFPRLSTKQRYILKEIADRVLKRGRT